MKTMYRALLIPMMEPVVLYVSATLGMAERTDVLDIGDNNPFQDMTTTMTIFRCLEKRSNSSSTGADTVSPVSGDFSSPILDWLARGAKWWSGN